MCSFGSPSMTQVPFIMIYVSLTWMWMWMLGPQTQTMIPLNIPALKRLRPRTSRRHLRLNLPSSRAVGCPPDPRLVVHLPMSAAGRILQTRMQILLLLRDGSGASARSHLLPPLNDQYQQPNQTLRELEAVNFILMTINFARNGVF